MSDNQLPLNPGLLTREERNAHTTYILEHGEPPQIELSKEQELQQLEYFIHKLESLPTTMNDTDKIQKYKDILESKRTLLQPEEPKPYYTKDPNYFEDNSTRPNINLDSTDNTPTQTPNIPSELNTNINITNNLKYIP